MQILTGDRTTLVWAEEFEEDGAPCVKNWNHETIPPNNGSWWNEEVQYYTDRRDNSIVEDGVLKIIAKKRKLPFQRIYLSPNDNSTSF